MARDGRRFSIRAAVGLALFLILGQFGGTPVALAAGNSSIGVFTVSGSPFAPDFAPLTDHVTINLKLARNAKVTLTIRSAAGVVVRTLARRVKTGAGDHVWTWDGRDGAGALLPDGAYAVRLRTLNTLGPQTQDRPIRKGVSPIFPANPAAIVIAVDPGHGGRYPGAVRNGFMEKDFNLDIGLQLGALLRRAGVTVVMSRDTDRAVDEPPGDHNGDGQFDRYDDDLLRNDSANLARADVAIHVHNNASTSPSAHGTKSFTSLDRSWTPRAVSLAELVVDEEFHALEAYSSTAFKPVNGGVHGGWYYYVGPYDLPFLTRPTLMPSVLSESLYVSNPAELEALKNPDIRLSLAAAIYIALADYLNARDLGIGYELLSRPPASVAVDTPVDYTVRVTNRGNVASAGWSLELHNVPGVSEYDGSGAIGTLIGSAGVPDGLAPGAFADVTVSATAPGQAGDWLVKGDILLPGGSYASVPGVAPLQTALTTVAP